MSCLSSSHRILRCLDTQSWATRWGCSIARRSSSPGSFAAVLQLSWQQFFQRTDAVGERQWRSWSRWTSCRLPWSYLLPWRAQETASYDVVGWFRPLLEESQNETRYRQRSHLSSISQRASVGPAIRLPTVPAVRPKLHADASSRAIWAALQGRVW